MLPLPNPFGVDCRAPIIKEEKRFKLLDNIIIVVTLIETNLYLYIGQ
jgi:hypothetical protein